MMQLLDTHNLRFQGNKKSPGTRQQRTLHPNGFKAGFSMKKDGAISNSEPRVQQIISSNQLQLTKTVEKETW
jgi:hypothetical protein